MKKWFLAAVLAFSFSIAYANDPERVATLSAKVILKNQQGYFALSDGSQWKAIGFSKRWRSVSEWWNNVQLVPEHYECVPNDWFLGTQVEAYSKYNNLNVNEADASNQDVLKQCTHLLVNSRTGQVLFAIALHPVDCVVQVFNDAYGDGYNQGLVEGRLSSYKDASDSYQAGYSLGYREGYEAAFK